jgi:hypothetical protein
MDVKGAKRDNTPGGSLPSKSTVSSTPSIPDYTPSPLLQKKLFAFRTITTLLSCIQAEASFKRYKFGTNPHVPRNLREEVLLCDALAHLAIIDHEVIALTTNHRSNQNELEIMACHPPVDTNLPDEKDRPSSPGMFEKVLTCLETWQFVFTRNTRKKERNKVPLAEYPSIDKVERPSDYPNLSNDRQQTLFDYLDALEHNW